MVSFVLLILLYKRPLLVFSGVVSPRHAVFSDSRQGFPTSIPHRHPQGWFSQLERRALYRGVFSNVKELRDEIHRFIKVHNAKHAKPFRWTKSANAILASVQRAKDSITNNTKN